MILGNRSTVGFLVSTVLGVSALVGGGTTSPSVQLEAGLGTPLMLARKAGRAYLRVNLRGMAPARAVARPPVNLALVLDRSGSMAGEKIERARDMARTIVERLAPGDIVSVVAFDSTVEIVVPATRVGDGRAVRAAIDRIGSAGGTALFGGVARGGAEVRKFKDHRTVNRMILLSDGEANVGPSTPQELGALGASFAKEGITVTTVGLGLHYNENLMSQLAQSSDGNHCFAERPADLDRLMRLELGSALSVVAKDIDVSVHCAPGIRPVRVLGRETLIDGSTVHATFNQVYVPGDTFLVLEVDVPAEAAGATRKIADVDVVYQDLVASQTRKARATVAARFSDSSSAVAESTSKEVMTDALEMLAVETGRTAIALRDQGRIEEAREVLVTNARHLGAKANEYRSEKLKAYANQREDDLQNLDEANWPRQRKTITKWSQTNPRSTQW